MRLRDLGPLVVSVDGADQPVRGDRSTAILALLLMSANRTVSVDALVDALWGESASPGSVGTLESHIHRMRQLLEPGRAAGEAPSVLLRQDHGYRLVVADDQVDSLRFAKLADEAEALATSGQHDRALRRCDEALGLWRGAPAGRANDEVWAQAWVARLGELRAQVAERRVEALLELGDPDRALAELELLIRDMPFRERLHAQRMLALYRCGRTNEALAAYQQARTTLMEEMGLAPGPQLQAIQRRILDHDPALAAASSRAPVVPRPAPELHLPVFLTPLIGRISEVGRIAGLLNADRLVTLTGTAGCGKTRLAVEVARQAAGQFPDGVWFIDLAAVTDGQLVAEVIISTVGFAPPVTGTALDALHSYVRGRRMILVLDNCEHVLTDAAFVAAALLADDAELTILATSREPLDLDGELIWPISPLSLQEGSGTEPSDSAAVELFRHRLSAGAPGVIADRSPGDVRRLAGEICQAVDGLPLAIELAAARARAFTLEEILKQVTANPGSLARIGRTAQSGHGERRRSLHSALDWSYRLLSPSEQFAHRRLAVLPGPFTVDAAAAVTGLSLDEAADVLAMLVHRSLLSPARSLRPGGPSLFRQLAVVRSHAAHLLAGEADAALDQRDAWVYGLASRRPRLGRAAEWFALVDDDLSSIRAMLDRNLLQRRTAAGALVASRLQGYWYYRTQISEGVRWLQLAAAALERGQAASADPATAPPVAPGTVKVDALEILRVRMGLAKLLALQGRVDLALPHIDSALAAADEIEPGQRAAFGDNLAILANCAWAGDDHGLADQLSRQAVEYAEATGDADLAILSEAVRCLAVSVKADIGWVAAHAEDAYARAQAVGHAFAAWTAAVARTVAAQRARDPGTGIAWCDRALELHRRQGSERAGVFVEIRASLSMLAGDYQRAVELYAAARAHTRRAGMTWPREVTTTGLIAEARAALDPDEYQQAWRAGEGLTLAQIVAGAPDTATG